jgi:hypothetical protein
MAASRSGAVSPERSLASSTTYAYSVLSLVGQYPVMYAGPP